MARPKSAILRVQSSSRKLEVVRFAAGVREEEVFGLEVAVNDASIMAVGKGVEYAANSGRGFSLGVHSFGFEPLKELSALEVLENQADVGVVLEDRVQLDDVGLAESSDDLDLVNQIAHRRRLFPQLGLVDCFDRELPLRPLVPSQVDLRAAFEPVPWQSCPRRSLDRS